MSIDVTNLTGLTENNAASQGSSLDTGDLRRRFGMPRTSELSFERDPWFYLISKFRKKPETDSEYKFFEKRTALTKRYAYVTGFHATARASISDADATFNVAAGATCFLRMGTDYKNAGNLPNVYDEVSSTARTAAFEVSSAGTMPKFFIAGQMINIPVCATAGGGGVSTGYYTAKVETVYSETATTHQDLLVTIKSIPISGDYELCSFTANSPITSVHNKKFAKTKSDLTSKQTHIIGTSYASGTGYPNSWSDNPYSSGFAYMQIFKTALEMDEELMATVLKHDPNEWMRLWGDKLIEHNLDIERALHFGHQGKEGKDRQLQGIIDYGLQYAPMYDLDLTTKTSDDFMHDISNVIYPGSGANMNNMVFLADTPTYDWLNLLGGLLKNNTGISSQFRSDMVSLGTARAGLLNIELIKTGKGVMKLVHDVHLDSSPIKIIGMSLDEVEINPLVGNGKNRDTAVYAGIQSLEKDGVDAYTSLVQTQLGQVIKRPEKHIVWKDAE